MKRIEVIVRELEVRDLLEIANQVARKHFVTLEELLGRTRGSPESRARQELWHRLYDQIPSFPKLGEIFDRHHSTVLTGVHRHQRRMRANGAAPTSEGAKIDEQATGGDSVLRPIKKCDDPPMASSDEARSAS